MKQITIVADDRPGIIAEIAYVLANKGVNIESLDGEALEGHGIVVFTVDKYDEALRALRDAGMKAITEDAILVRMKDEAGALARIALRFQEANVNLRSVRIVRREGGSVLVAISTRDLEKAKALVQDVLVG